MAEPFAIPNETQGVLTSDFVLGTDTHCHLVAIGLFDAGGGHLRIKTTDAVHWCLITYTGVSTNDLTGLTQVGLSGQLYSTGDGAYTFPATSIVERAQMGEDVSKRIMGPASATSGHFFKANGTSGKLASAGAIAAGELPAIPLTGLATQATDTIVANVTAGSAAPTAVAVAEQRVVGRITGGHITDLTTAQLKTLCAYLTDLVDDTTPDLGGPLTVGDNSILLNKAPADGKWSGFASSFTAHEDFAIGEVGFINADAEMQVCDADAIATAGGIGIATAAISSGNAGVFLLFGYLHLTGASWTVGAKLYLNETATASIPTATLVTGSAGVSQILGVAVAADIILFYGNLAMAVI